MPLHPKNVFAADEDIAKKYIKTRLEKHADLAEYIVQKINKDYLENGYRGNDYIKLNIEGCYEKKITGKVCCGLFNNTIIDLILFEYRYNEHDLKYAILALTRKYDIKYSLHYRINKYTKQHYIYNVHIKYKPSNDPDVIDLNSLQNVSIMDSLMQG